MKKIQRILFLVYATLLIPLYNFAQVPNLGTTESFAIFTAVGAINNDGTSIITGDVGTDVGAFNGFPPGIILGSIHVADPISAQAAIDVALAYSYLQGLPCEFGLPATIGNGQILGPGVYCISTAAVLNGNLILDGEGDPNARFVFQIDGAFETSTLASITFMNNASLCNVYWQVNGAFDLGEGSSFKGTIITNGAISLLLGSTLEGRALSQAGAIDLHTNVVSLGIAPVPAIITAQGAITVCAGDSVVLTGNIDGIWNTGEFGLSITVYASGEFYVSNTNDCGIAESNRILVTISADILPPVITCPIDVSVDCNESLLPINTGFALAVDDCDLDPVITFTDSIVVGLCLNNSDIFRIWIATDSTGNTSSCIQLIAVLDLTLPTIICPSDVTVQCTSGIPIISIDAVIADDNCSAPVITFLGDEVINLTCLEQYTISRVYQAADLCGNIAICVQTITVFDTIAPAIVCPVSLTVQCESLVPAVDVALIVAPDNCGLQATVTHLGDVITNLVCVNEFVLLRTYQALDLCGNLAICVQTITVLDTLAPAIVCPVSLTVQCASLVPAVNVALIVAPDNCGLQATVTHLGDVITNLVCVNEFVILRTYQALDLCGNLNSCVQTITVFDNIAPLITCPASDTVSCALEVLPVDLTTILTSDNCITPVTVTLTSEVVSNLVCVNNYVLTRTFQALDDCGNLATCAQVIVVLDNVAPIITCPVVANVACLDLVLPVDLSLITVTDNCGNAVITYTGEVISNQICENEFVLVRTYLATDDCGNTSTCIQMVSVLDTVPPAITFIDARLLGFEDGDTLVVQCYGQNPQWDLPVFTIGSVNATDLCAGDVTVAYTKSLLDDGDCATEGFIQIHQLLWTATDICGNSQSVSLLLKLVDTIPPVIFGIPVDITVDCAELLLPAVNITALDECLCACVVVSEQSAPQPGCQDGMALTITWTAMDQCGNITNETQNITLIDSVGPTITVIHPDIAGIENGTIMEVECNEDGFPRFVQEMDISSVYSPDVCGGSVQVVLDTTITVSSDCKTSGFMEERTFLWTVSDLCGNSSTFTFSVRMIDTIAPLWVGVPDTVCIGSGLLSGIVATDNCNNPYSSFTDLQIANPCGVGTATLRRYTATDECGNTTVATSVIIPIEPNIPVILFSNQELKDMLPGETVISTCSRENGRYTSFGPEDVYIEGVCTVGANVTFTEEIIEARDCSVDSIKAIVALIWTVTDICGNTASRTIVATVVDNTAPVFQNFISEQTIGCAEAMPLNFATDECGEVFFTSNDSFTPSNCIYEYDVIRLITAEDECGNTTTLEQIIHVKGGTGPVLSGLEKNICDDLTMPKVTAYDPCTSQPLNVVMTQDTLDVVCANGMVITRTWSAADTCGRETIFTQTIVVNDHTPPVITIADSSVLYPFWTKQHSTIYLWQIEAWKKINALDSTSISIADECDQQIVPVLTQTSVFSEDCVSDGYYERRYYTWIATDICNNADTVTVTVDIIDDIPPVFVDFPYDITLHCEAIPPVPTLTAMDYSDSVSIVYSDTIMLGTVVGVNIMTRTWTATDVCGNSTSEVQTITWIPDNNLACEINLPELVECNSHGVYIFSSLTGGEGIASYTWEVVGEECFIQSGQGTPFIEIYVGWAPVKIILTVTDSAGCVSMCMTTLDCVSASLSNAIDPALVSSKLSDPVLMTQSNLTTGADISELKLWPNPAIEGVQLSFLASDETALTVNILNMLGQTVYTDKMTVQAGFNSHHMVWPQNLDGNYIVQVVSNQHVYTRQLAIIAR